MNADKIRIELPLKALHAVCDQYPIRRLSVFGSALRDDFTDQSDVDLLVEFFPQSKITYFDLFDLQEAFTGLIGRKVDLLTPGALSEYFRDDVLQKAVAIYER